MRTRPHSIIVKWHWLSILLLGWPVLSSAQVPVDDSGKPIGEFEQTEAYSASGEDDIPLLSPAELEELVGPIALYPDDLLAVVLPASTFPLQIVEAGRFLENLEDDPSLKPDKNWDDSVVALTNYPEVVELLNDDLDWTWRLGEAVVGQQPDVIAAVESFRDRAYTAGNLKSDEHQTVSQSDGVIEIAPVQEDVIYVPYYEPERVVVYQPRPVYHYYPRPYPVYYYPYPAGYAFHYGYFWGVTSAYTLGWYTNSLHVLHHSYHGHPYYGHSYWDYWWYRRPSIHVHNSYYRSHHYRRSHNHYRYGDYWRPRHHYSLRYSDQRITRNRHYPGGDRHRDRTREIRFRDRPDVAPRTIDRDRSTVDRRVRETDHKSSHSDRSRRSEPLRVQPESRRGEQRRADVGRAPSSERIVGQSRERAVRQSPQHTVRESPERMVRQAPVVRSERQHAVRQESRQYARSEPRQHKAESRRSDSKPSRSRGSDNKRAERSGHKRDSGRSHRR